MPTDEVHLYSDFYRCSACDFIDYSHATIQNLNARCTSCRGDKVKWRRLEVFEVLELLRKVKANVVPVPPPPPPMLRSVPPPPPPLMRLAL